MQSNEIIQSLSIETSALSSVGNALQHCDITVLEEHTDDVIQQLIDLLKKPSSTFTVTMVTSVIKELVKRLGSSSKTTPHTLSNLVSAILSLHMLQSCSSQAVALNCLAVLVRVYPNSLKSHYQSIVEWTKKGLYSGHEKLTQESAILIVSLYSSSKNPDELSTLFTSCLNLSYSLLRLLYGEDKIVLPSFNLSPNLPPDGQERLSAIVTAITSINRVLCYCLALESSSKHVAISLVQLMEIIWTATGCKLMSLSLRAIILQSSWQLFLVVIQRCGVHLLPYSESIESSFLTTLQDNNTTPLIIALVVQCIDYWVTIQGHNPVFIQSAVSSLCLIGHNCIQKLNSKSQLRHEGSEVWLLYHCISTLCVCLQDYYHDLPSLLIKGLQMLVFALPSFLSAQVTTKSTELAILVKEIMNTSSNLITEAANHQNDDTLPLSDQHTATTTTTTTTMELQSPDNDILRCDNNSFRNHSKLQLPTRKRPLSDDTTLSTTALPLVSMAKKPLSDDTPLSTAALPLVSTAKRPLSDDTTLSTGTPPLVSMAKRLPSFSLEQPLKLPQTRPATLQDNNNKLVINTRIELCSIEVTGECINDNNEQIDEDSDGNEENQLMEIFSD